MINEIKIMTNLSSTFRKKDKNKTKQKNFKNAKPVERAGQPTWQKTKY